jgi:hypothetical protein
MKTANVDLQDLKNVISVVERKRQSFLDISDEEMSNRRNFVNEKSQFLREIESQMTSERSKKKIQSDANAAKNKQNGSGRKDSTGSTEGKKKNLFESMGAEAAAAETLAGKKLRETQIIEEQDEVLRDMSAAVDRLGSVAGEININLKQKEKAMEEMDMEMDIATNMFDTVLGKLDTLLASSNNGRICCIIGLAGVAFLLLFLIIYT